MPGELTFSQMLSNVDMSLDRMIKILINSLSPLTPQQTEQESSRVLKDLISPLRTESPLTQVYTEGVTYAFKKPAWGHECPGGKSYPP